MDPITWNCSKRIWNCTCTSIAARSSCKNKDSHRVPEEKRICCAMAWEQSRSQSNQDLLDYYDKVVYKQPSNTENLRQANQESLCYWNHPGVLWISGILHVASHPSNHWPQRGTYQILKTVQQAHWSLPQHQHLINNPSYCLNKMDTV